jgi:hypothetical protein
MIGNEKIVIPCKDSNAAWYIYERIKGTFERYVTSYYDEFTATENPSEE